MKTKRRLILLLTVLAMPIARAMATDVLTVAVFDFESKDEAVRGTGPKVAALINANLSAEPNLITLERAELDKALSEQELGLSGTVSSETAAHVGKLTGAKVLITGRVFQVEGKTAIVAKIIGTETSRVYGEIVKGASGTDIIDLSTELSKKIAADLAQKKDTLVAKVETREERIAKIAASVAGKKLPSVSVKIEERHFGRPIIDPAAQTELSIVLKKAGFQVMDDKSNDKPDIEVTGQAFSAYGMRNGNLISCRSRVELSAHRHDGGKLLAEDAQTSVAVDVAEETAAKTALENAALEVSARFVPNLVQ